MKPLFRQTYYFWVFTRITFIAFYIIDSFIVFPKAADGLTMLLDIVSLAYIGLMTYNTVLELQNKTSHRVAKYIVGGISILIALAIFFVVMGNSGSNIFFVLILIAWLALLGIFDLTIMNRKDEEEFDMPE